MRIFVFTTVFAPRVGGIERLTEVLAREWVEMGHDVVIATTTPGPTSGYPFRVIRSGSLATFVRWGRWCDVHLQMNISLKYTPLGIIGALGRPVFVSHQTAYESFSKTGTIKQYMALRVPSIACSAYIARRLGHELQNDPCLVVGNPFDDRTFQKRTDGNDRHNDIAFLGRLVSDKGCDTLLYAVAELRKRGLRPRLTVIGDGEERPRLEAIARDLGLIPQIRFTGTLSPPQIADELNRHRFLVVPSRWAEPFGIVALEGLACGCVPIVARRGGLPEAIGPHGYTFENGDATDLARVLAHVLTHPEQARTRLEGVEHHLARHTARRVAEEYVRVLESLIAKCA